MLLHCNLSVNRTLMELKSRHLNSVCGSVFTVNRTLMELKCRGDGHDRLCLHAVNRTIMEFKYGKNPLL